MLIDQLDDQGAQALGLDRDDVTYCALAEVEGASKKTIRDAGTVAVTTLGHGNHYIAGVDGASW